MESSRQESIEEVSNRREAVSSKKKAANKDTLKKSSGQKLDFLKWLEMFASGVQKEKLTAVISNLNNEFQNIASELVIAISGTGTKPTAKFKIEKLPQDFIKILRTKINNPYFAIALLCNPTSEIELKKLIIADLSKVTLSNEDVEYLLNKIAAIKDPDIQGIVWNEFLISGILQQESWQNHQLSFLDWGLIRGLQMAKPIETLMGLRAATNQFKNLETPKRNKIFRKLLDLDNLSFLAFLLHISSDSFTTKFVEELIGKKNKIVLLTFLENRQSFVGPWLEDFERQFIAPILKTTLDGVMSFEDLLPFLIKQSYFSHLIPADTLSRAVSRSFKRNDDLSVLLRDARVELLTAKVEDLIGENKQITQDLSSERSRSQEQEKRIRDFENAIENYESRLRSQMKSENLGSDALTLNAKMDLLKGLVENLDHLLQGTDAFQIERALQKIGVMRLGEPGSDFTWDPEVCETLTGAAVENGIVIRSGYTWLNGEKKVVIRRVLLK